MNFKETFPTFYEGRLFFTRPYINFWIFVGLYTLGYIIFRWVWPLEICKPWDLSPKVQESFIEIYGAEPVWCYPDILKINLYASAVTLIGFNSYLFVKKVVFRS